MSSTSTTYTSENPIVAIGIGPGDAELITVKGLKALQQADVVFYPASGREVDNSFSKKIIDCYNLTCRLTPMVISMGSRTRLNDYEAAFRMIHDEHKAGKKVAIVSEGDILFYSTFGYLLTHIKEHNLPFRLIPGIPAFILGASAMENPLVESDQSLRIVARPQSFEQLEHICSETATVVVMKMSVLKDWHTFLITNSFSFFYAEHLGTEQQFTTTSLEILKQREIPYFSIIIIKQTP